jgi:hypothetical protein
MADQVERAERALSALIRLGISAVLPVWALAMIVLGAEYRSLWWLGTGVVVAAIGLLFLAGSPLANLIYPSR